MKTSKHTEGQWIIQHQPNLMPCIISKVFNLPIAHLSNMTGSGAFCEEAESNSRLIAAAPDLLDALQILLCNEDVVNLIKNNYQYLVATNAIEKATKL